MTTTTELHPVFAGVLAAIETAPVIAARLSAATESYERALKLFDWNFEYSDHGENVRLSRGRLRTLRDLQRDLDPDGVIWMRHAPASYPPTLETVLRQQQGVSHG